jgi:hypothetical protein
MGAGNFPLHRTAELTRPDPDGMHGRLCRRPERQVCATVRDTAELGDNEVSSSPIGKGFVFFSE